MEELVLKELVSVELARVLKELALAEPAVLAVKALVPNCCLLQECLPV